LPQAKAVMIFSLLKHLISLLSFLITENYCLRVATNEGSTILRSI